MVGGARSHHLDVLNDVPCCHTRHARVAHGYDGDGTSNALPAGEYPILLCAAIAAALTPEDPTPRARWPTWQHDSRFSAQARALVEWSALQEAANAMAATAVSDMSPAAAPPFDATLAIPAGEETMDATGPHWRAAPEAIPVSWPERSDVAGERAREARTAALRYASRRRAEPEHRHVLSGEEFPVPHPPPTTAAAPDPGRVPWPTGAPQPPVHISQLYNPGVYASIRHFISVVAADLRAAEKAACEKRAAPPLPFRDTLEYPAAMSQPAWARACVWATSDPHDCVPLQPYSEIERPVQDVDWRFFERVWQSVVEVWHNRGRS
ncbi:hypothetical protein AB1Y20_022497 [Prymnesium parvum]|uniref:Uncharacterized protein n=1 Tax=Prymnesium parvum TaxID=97485 RepID=A0AB34JJ62_PRYPA